MWATLWMVMTPRLAAPSCRSGRNSPTSARWGRTCSTAARTGTTASSGRSATRSCWRSLSTTSSTPRTRPTTGRHCSTSLPKRTRNSQLAALLRFLIKLQKIWQTFVDGWNATIGPLVADIENLADDLTGGVLSEFGVVMDELKLAFKLIAEEELLTFKDIFSGFDTCLQIGFGEKLFLWSDMSHYRRPSALCQAFVKQANLMRDQ